MYSLLKIARQIYGEGLQVMHKSYYSFFPQRDQFIMPRLNKFRISALTYSNNFQQDRVDVGKYDLAVINEPNGSLVAKYLALPYVFDFIDWYSEMVYVELGNGERYKSMQDLERQAVVNAEHVICQSTNIQDLIDPSSKSSVVSNGVEYNLFNKAIPLNREEDKFQIIYQGKLGRWYKNMENVVKAMDLLDDTYHLLIIGDGVLKAELEQMSGDNVSFIGAIDYESIPQYTKSSDIAVFAVDDCSPLAIYEYMASGKPIVQLKGRINWFLSEKNAILVDNTPKAFADAFILLRENPELCKAMGTENEEYARRFDWDILAKKYQDTLIEVIENRRMYFNRN